MTLLFRKRIIKVGVEDTKGTKVAGDTAGLIFEHLIQPTAPFEPRRGGGTHIGNNEPGTLGEKSGTLNFTAELRSNGSGEIDPFLAALLQASCFKLNGSWQPSSNLSDHKTLSFDVWEDGKKKGLAGAAGTWTINAPAGNVVTLNFEFTGRWIAPVDESMPGGYSPATTSPMKFADGTFSIGGSPKRISSAELTANNNVVMVADPNAVSGIAFYQVTDIDPVLKIDPEDELVNSEDYYAAWLAGTEAAVVLEANDGTDKCTITLPKVQYREVQEAEREGMLTNDITAQCNNDDGDDAVQIEVAAISP